MLGDGRTVEIEARSTGLKRPNDELLNMDKTKYVQAWCDHTRSEEKVRVGDIPNVTDSPEIAKRINEVAASLGKVIAPSYFSGQGEQSTLAVVRDEQGNEKTVGLMGDGG